MDSTSPLKLLKELDLLVSTGVGVAPIAPALGNVLSKIVGAESHGVCWFDEAGMPQGFYHHGARRDTEELFMNHYEELFVGPHEYTPFWRMRNKGRDVGNALRSSKAYFRSNTYNLLIKPNGCRFLLEAMIDLDGVTRLAVCFFRTVENPFTETDEKKLIALMPVLRRAIGQQTGIRFSRSATAETGFMLISIDGQHIEMMDTHAQQLLTSMKLFDQSVSLIESVTTPPRFIQMLCARFGNELVNTEDKQIDIAGGSLFVRASRLNAMPSACAEEPSVSLPNKKIAVSLQFNQASALEAVRSISAWGLSPLQGRIAMFAASGGSRVECAAHHGVSKEALKKHLRQIYSASSCKNWQELAQTLRVQ